MSKRYLLDINAAIARINGDAAFDKFISGAEEIFVPIIALGELYYGAERSARIEANLAAIENFLSGRTILNCDTETARWFGRILRRLHAKGRPIPDNDIWIAAIAFQHDLTVLTRDKHFDDVDGVSLASW